MKFPSESRWLLGSVVLFLFIQALTYYQVTTDSDDGILSRLSSPVSLIEPACLEGPADRPVDRRPECRTPDPFASLEGSGCRWFEFTPFLSCRVGGIPVSILSHERFGGAQEVAVTLLSKVLGPLAAVRVANALVKLALVFLLFWMLRIFRLPASILPLFVSYPVFQGLFEWSWTALLHPLLFYLTFCLAVSPERKRFFASMISLLCGTYVYSSTPFTVIPAMAVLQFQRKDTRRALLLGLAAAACLALRLAVFFVHPWVHGTLQADLHDPTVWNKGLTELRGFLGMIYGLLSLSDAGAGYISDSTWVGVRVLGVGVFAMVLFSLRRIWKLILLLVVSSGVFLYVGHYFVGRVQLFFPIALIAIYLSVESLASSIRARGARHLAWLPWLWLAVTASVSCAHWIYTFRTEGPPMIFNADYYARLGRFLSHRSASRPFMTNAEQEVGMLDVFTAESVRPLYVDARGARPPRREGTDPIDYLLSSWPRLSGGTLVQRSYEELDGRRYTIGLAELESFARGHGIEIQRADLFPYRGNEGYWIIEFANRRWQ